MTRMLDRESAERGRRSRHTRETLRTLAALIGLALLTVAIHALAYRGYLEFVSAQRSASAAQELTIEVEELLSTIKDAETGQRGFLLTGDDPSSSRTKRP